MANREESEGGTGRVRGGGNRIGEKHWVRGIGSEGGRGSEGEMDRIERVVRKWHHRSTSQGR